MIKSSTLIIAHFVTGRAWKTVLIMLCFVKAEKDLCENKTFGILAKFFKESSKENALYSGFFEIISARAKY